MSAPPPSYECAVGLVDDERDIPEIRSSSSSSSANSLLSDQSKIENSTLDYLPPRPTSTACSAVQPKCHYKLKCIHVFLMFVLGLFLLFKFLPDVYKPLCTRLIGLLDSNSTTGFDEISFRDNITMFCDSLWTNRWNKHSETQVNLPFFQVSLIYVNGLWPKSLMGSRQSYRGDARPSSDIPTANACHLSASYLRSIIFRPLRCWWLNLNCSNWRLLVVSRSLECFVGLVQTVLS